MPGPILMSLVQVQVIRQIRKVGFTSEWIRYTFSVPKFPRLSVGGKTDVEAFRWLARDLDSHLGKGRWVAVFETQEWSVRLRVLQ